MQPRQKQSEKGFTVMEMLLVVALVALIAGISLPMLASAMQRARANGATEVLAAAIRDARARAVTSGWQYQVVAYDSGGAVPNAFRMQGFDPANGGVAPPAGTATDPPFYGSNQMYEAYTPLAKAFGNAQIQVAGGTFRVTFDSRGQQVGACVPATCVVQVNTPSRTATLTVTTAGGVRLQ
jgi:prepilin-type N-terminal cleavage/methylation domain-containing protein